MNRKTERKTEYKTEVEIEWTYNYVSLIPLGAFYKEAFSKGWTRTDVVQACVNYVSFMIGKSDDEGFDPDREYDRLADFLPDKK